MLCFFDKGLGEESICVDISGKKRIITGRMKNFASDCLLCGGIWHKGERYYSFKYKELCIPSMKKNGEKA